MAKRFGDGDRQHIYHQLISTIKPPKDLSMPQRLLNDPNRAGGSSALDLNQDTGMETTMNSLDNSAQRAVLVAAKAARAEARVRLNSAAAALARAQRMDDASRTKVLDLEQSVVQAQTKHGQQLAASIAAGDPSEALPAPNWDVIPMLASAKIHAAITAEALKSLQSTHAHATTALKAAEIAVGKEADRILNAQADALAAEVDRAFDNLISLGDQLREFAPDHFGSRLDIALPVASPRVLAALERIPQALNGIHTPINQLRAVVNDPGPLAKRREALIADGFSG
jgi:hypothetical protein